MLKFSFVIPTYNAHRHLDNCLKSIRQQKYPQENVEIIIADGGSADETIEIAKKYDCKILENKKRLAEYGVQLGMRESKGDLSVVFAADNELVGDNWLTKVEGVFSSHQDLSAVWGRLVSGENDSSLNKYFELIQSDPLNWFLNDNLKLYKKNAVKIHSDCFKFKMNGARPLVWGANGLVYRTQKIKPIWMCSDYLGDNDAFQIMIERLETSVAYFDSPFVYHHHVGRLSDWIKKWKRNFLCHFLDKQNSRNMNWVINRDFKKKFLCWIVYNAIPVFLIGHSLYLAIKEKNRYWLYHPAASLAQFFTYCFLVVGTKMGRAYLKKSFYE